MAGYLSGDVDEWIYIDIADQHPDSIRFIKDCEKAIGKEIKILKSQKGANIILLKAKKGGKSGIKILL